MVTVVEMEKSSPAGAAGLVVGDRITRVNGEAVEDFLDFHFAVAEEVLEIETSAAGKGGRRVCRVTREPGRPLGIRVEEGAVRCCSNKCIFCFVDQLPRGLRRSLYVKDGDYRYSFLQGNYITGTNLSERHIARIVRMGLSPLYFSVHSTDPEVRARLLGGCARAEVMPLLERLVGQGVELHFQVVLCPGINDGPVLEKTITGLEALGPGARSLAVVPVGLTRHRRGLYRLDPVSAEGAVKTLRLIHRCQRHFRSRRGSRFVFAADELYLLAGRKIPSHRAYEGFPQLENGVGLVRREMESVKRAARSRGLERAGLDGCYRVVTGTLFAPVLAGLVSRYDGLVPGRLETVAVKNRLLGESVTVAGLLAGGDILEALKQGPTADAYLLPAAALNPDGVFLDDMPLEHLRSALEPAPVIVAPGLFRALKELSIHKHRGSRKNISCKKSL
ncbi:MAG: DUF512 domain-containing protein [Candidatus Glassbacteria bacterium]|nr:DUF512 domain-containing protein [Candidatus Glassbacteria bacterium]